MKSTSKKLLIMGPLLMVGMCIVESYAKVRSISSQRNFEQRVAEKGICVVLFYDKNDKADMKTRENNKRLNNMFNDVSDKQSYDDADIQFIRVNAARKEFDNLIDQYGITNTPSVMLFKDGRHMTDKIGQVLLLSGFVTREALESFIDTHYGSEIHALNVAKDDARKERLQEEQESWEPYFYPRDIFARDYDPSQRSME